MLPNLQYKADKERNEKPRNQQPRLFYSFCPETLIPEDHPLRAIKKIVEESFKALDKQFAGMYSSYGGPWIAPEWLFKDLVGALKGTGFGRLIRIDINEHASEVPPPSSLTSLHQEPCPTRLLIEFRQKAPFCLAKHRLAENLLESESTIPGAAIKGAPASTLNSLAGRPSSSAVDGATPEP